MPINKFCSICNKAFKVPPSSSNQKYCSSACYGVAQRGRNICSVDGCGGYVLGWGFCNKHYLRYKRYGSPYAFKEKIAAPRKDNKKVFTTSCMYCGKTIVNPTYKRKYCSSRCSGLADRTPFILKKGYKKVLVPGHTRADKKGYVFEHIIIIEDKMKRQLCAGEVCHHLDGNKLNNAPENLMVFENNSFHLMYHHSQSDRHLLP